MALPTRVNVTAAANWTGTSATTLASTAQSVTTGNTLVVAVGANATSGQRVTGLTDTAGNTYVLVTHVSGPDLYREELWYARNITGHASNVVTATWSATVAYRGIAVVQYAGLSTALPADGTTKGTQAAGGTTVSAGNLQTTRADTVQVIVPRWGYSTLDTITWPSGFSRITTGGDLNVDIAEAFVTAAGTTSLTITHTYTAIAKLALVAAFTATPAPAPLVAAIAAAPGINGGTTAAIDTTGAALLLVGASWYSGGGASAPTVSDSKGNTWTALTTHGTANDKQRLSYVLAPTVGTGHTFTVSSTGSAVAVLVLACSGGWTYQTESGASGVGVVASGSVTPAANGALLVTGLGSGNSTSDVLSPGAWVITGAVPDVSGVTVHGVAAYLVQAVAAAVNPSWSTTAADVGVSTAVFLPVAGAAARAETYVWGPI